MKRFLFSVLCILLLTAGCGKGPSEQANPLSLVPETAMITVTLNDPAGIVRNIDGFIADGAPVLGLNRLENLLCEQLAIQSLDSMQERYGFDPSGVVVFWMENATPNSMGLAASAPDLSLFLTLMEEMGAVLTDEEPVKGNPVYSTDTGQGTIYITGSGGVVIMAMSSAKIETLLENLSGEGAEVTPASLTLEFNLAMIGPIIAGQMPMARTLMMQGLAEDPEMPDFVPGLMDVYMDGIQMVLTEADRMTVTVAAGSEDFVVTHDVTFKEGSRLAGMLVEQGGRDMLELVPGGDVATLRFRAPSEMAFGVTKAITDVFTADIPEENLQFWSSMTSNVGMAMYRGDPFHVVAAYEISDGITLEDVSSMYQDYLLVFGDVFRNSGVLEEAFTITDNGMVTVDGIDFYSLSMSIAPDSLNEMSFNYWMTIHDGALLLEIADEPVLIGDVVAGRYTPAELADNGDIAGQMSLQGYLSMVMAFSPEGVGLPETGSDVMVMWDGGFENGAIHTRMTMNGGDAFATGFAFFEYLSALM